MVSSRPAALLVHGLGGSAYDLGALGRTLEEADIVTHTPLLPGHGGEPEDLLSVRWQDWVETIRKEYLELKTRHKVVHLAGVCLGGLVALEVARLENHKDGLALYAPPLFLDGWSLPKLTWARHIVYRIPGLAKKMRVPEVEPFGIKNARIRKAIQQRFERGERFHYAYIPLACIRQVDGLRRQLMSRLEQITCPTLIVHADEDDITSPRSAHHLQRHLGGKVDFMPLSNSYHMVMVDNERGEVLKRSLKFFNQRAQAPATAAEQNGWALFAAA
ncbi:MULTISPECIES: alpha/beta hydrolase [Chromobacterium]|uniref:Alpha/beta fold hydrolase n=2 Tax=Chromobacterium TaxID=535 RepID=A0A1W0CM62_9NEIS|nr:MULTISPECIES: alpha/beta fold hydrolase [Chromobacterium]AXT48342.1 alpha/beta fold hydrolase [Chromobacterium rhizoryzae]MBK0415565.1 alpha/beta fold hydrolase [Chromobacterium haemolyticum]MBO0415015.1 alpha/beta fold hydrolase [Chromobacterium haemolyticum]MBO0498276.1 alpha/beta fold hydrolase [Chromobacterium haemolyticum]MDH0340437.1 alpha/beta fold hydrolase [Chromobacterium haemolyticum]